MGLAAGRCGRRSQHEIPFTICKRFFYGRRLVSLTTAKARPNVVRHQHRRRRHRHRCRLSDGGTGISISTTILITVIADNNNNNNNNTITQLLLLGTTTISVSTSSKITTRTTTVPAAAVIITANGNAISGIPVEERGTAGASIDLSWACGMIHDGCMCGISGMFYWPQHD